MNLTKWFCSAVLAFRVGAWAAQSCPSQLVAHRHADLAAYNAKMDKSSHQKAAFAAMARPGVIVDLGSGSGQSAFDLAMLFPDSRIIGVDLDPNEVALSRAKHRAPNLEFRVGDAERPDFPENSVDTVFISSTLHHLTSYGEPRFDYAHVETSMANVWRMLRPGGILQIRDFVAPTDLGPMRLELPVADGSADLFERFAHDFRSHRNFDHGVGYRERPSARPGWRAFEVDHASANEFLLRKEYRSTYAAEIVESYLFADQMQIERSLERAGFRVLHSAPIYNSWIIDNWWTDKVGWLDLDGRPRPLPPTNYGVTAQKLVDGEGVRFYPRFDREQTSFLRHYAMRDTLEGTIYDVVERPGETVDVLPYFERGRELFVLTRQGYPRPILSTAPPALTGLRSPGYVWEPLTFIRDGGSPIFANLEAQLKKRANLAPGDLLPADLKFHAFYPSPGLVAERAVLLAVPIKDRPIENQTPLANYSGFSTSGVIKPLEATQILRSAQVGAGLDARLELGVYNLLLDERRSVGPWIGDAIALEALPTPPPLPAPTAEAPARRFDLADERAFGRFLRVEKREFAELGTRGPAISTRALEYITPRTMSSAVLSVLPIFKSGDDIFVGLERRHLPVVQMFEGKSNLTAAPAWRMPFDVKDMDAAKALVSERLAKDFGVTPGRYRTLGGAYHPSPGVSAELIYPLLAEVRPGARADLTWVRLKDLIADRRSIRDGQTAIVALRAAHALGLL